MGESSEPPVWDLSPLVESEDPEQVKKSVDDYLKKAEVNEERYKGRIKYNSASKMYDLYKELDSLRMLFTQAKGYASMRQSQDTSDHIAKELAEYARRVGSEFESKLVFFDIEIARALLENPEIINNPEVAEYRHELEKAREKGKYLLSESVEQLILDKDIFGIDSWSELHTRLRSTLKYKVTIKGEEKQLVFSEFQKMIESNPDREERRLATEAYYKGVSRDALVYATALKSVYGDHLKQTKLRNHPSVLTQSLVVNNISQRTLDALIDSIKENTQFIRRFLRIRAKAMGLSKLTGYDISPIRAAPFIDTQSDIPWTEAKRLVIEAYADFDIEAGDFVASLFEENRIDASIRPGKSASGFCRNIPALRTAYINIHHSGSLNDISVLAHECGHGLHGYYASENNKWMNFYPGSCLAETASIFGEMLLVDKILNQSDDNETRLVVLDRVLCSMYIMVFYQFNCYLFENSVFTALDNNERVDPERLNELWLAARTEIFGDSVEWSPGMEQWWVVPIHHYMPRYRFYNYPYSFGQLLSLVLYQLYKEEGESFVPKMKRILSAGGSESPKTLLAEIGLDLSDPNFWEIGFKQAESYLDEFESIVEKRT
ncbi:MAG: M3 family metallopeptidase [Candidatus Thorarchaeota archaeon]